MTTCKTCGDEFTPDAHQATAVQASRQFCSRACSAVSRRADPKMRFEKYVMPEPNSGCWIWLGSLNAKGYAVLNVNGNAKRASRFSYEIHKGEIPLGLSALHHCDNRACVNPEHLYVGTSAQNSSDMVRRGRSQRGNNHARAKLTSENVYDIKINGLSAQQCANRYGVSIFTIYDVRNGRRWGHVAASSATSVSAPGK